jgi:hypothetical protein
MTFAPMETATGPPAELPVPPDTPSARGSAPRAIVAVFVAVAICGVAAAASAGTFAADVGVPDRWDPRIERIADFVMGARELEFRHPVRVYFLNEAEYSIAINGAPKARTTKADRAEATRSAAFQRAIGFVEGDPDVEAAQDDLADSGTLAYYDIEKKVVNVRGTRLTANTRVTLAHELTHALQDQHFDLADRTTSGSSEEVAAIRTIVEGDAMTVESQYVDQLSDSERASYESEYGSASEQAVKDLAGVAAPLQASQLFPYAIGRPFVGWVQATDGGHADPGRLDVVMRRPPRDTAATFDVAGAARKRVTVTPPKIAGRRYLTDQVGAHSLFVMLSDRIDPIVAMDATDGWRGDSFTAAETKRAGDTTTRMCVSAEFAMASELDATQLDQAFAAWAAVMPAEAEVEHSATSRRVTLRTCDPGPTATARGPIGSSSGAVAYPANRIDLARLLIEEGASRRTAWCVADAAVRKLTKAELTAPDLPAARQVELRQQIETAKADC